MHWTSWMIILMQYQFHGLRIMMQWLRRKVGEMTIMMQCSLCLVELVPTQWFTTSIGSSRPLLGRLFCSCSCVSVCPKRCPRPASPIFHFKHGPDLVCDLIDEGKGYDANWNTVWVLCAAQLRTYWGGFFPSCPSVCLCVRNVVPVLLRQFCHFWHEFWQA